MTLVFLPDQCKTQETCEKTGEKNLSYQHKFLLSIRLTKCVTELFIEVLDCCKMFLIAIKPKICVKELLKKATKNLKHRNLFLISKSYIKICERAIGRMPFALYYVFDQYEDLEMCEKADERESYGLPYVPDHFKTREMYGRAVKRESYTLEYVPEQYKTQNMCEEAVDDYP